MGRSVSAPAGSPVWPARAAAAVALVGAGRAGPGARGVAAGRADLDADDVQALLLERPAQLAGGLGEEVRRLGRLGDDAGAEALRRVAQVDLDAAELLGPQRDPRAGDPALGARARP